MSFLFGKKTESQQAPSYTSLRLQTASYGLVIPVVFGTTRITGNVIWYGDFRAIAHTQDQQGGKGAGSSGTSSVSYTYTVSAAYGLFEGFLNTGADIIKTIWETKKKITSNTLFSEMGKTPYAEWSYLTTQHSDQSLIYPYLAWIGVANLDLGNSDALPNFSFEVENDYLGDGYEGNLDVNPATIIALSTTDPGYGLGLDSSILDLSDYAIYCDALGLYLSAAFTEQQSFQQHITDICLQTFCEPVWHDGSVLKIIPYVDTAQGSWTPNVTPEYDLTDDDFIYEEGEDPIVCHRSSPADAFNDIKIEYLNRANDYNTDIAEALDQKNIDLYGWKPQDPIKMHHITTRHRARKIAQFILQKILYVRNIFEFKVGWKYCRLEPMDVISINDTALGLVQYPVRINSIEEDETGNLAIIAEELPDKIGTTEDYDTQPNLGYAIDYNVAPGQVNIPFIFSAPGVLTTSGFEVWCGVSGGTNWGGCDVYVSFDNSAYKFIQHIIGGSKYGFLSAAFASGVNPDTVNTCSVDLTISNGTLLSGTQLDADNNVTLCLVGNELITYETANLTTTYNYNLTDYLRRGVYGSTIADHAIGESFARLDTNIIRIPYDPSYFGKTIYIKFCSFNIYGAATESLADVEVYTYTIGQSISIPSDINLTDLTVSQNGDIVTVAWISIPDLNLDGYEIRIADPNTPGWSTATFLAFTGKATSWSGTVPPQTWIFYVCGKDINGNYSSTPASYIFSSINVSNILAGGTNQRDAGWPGTLTNFVKHFSGLLIPTSQGYASDDGWDTFDQFCPNPYSTSTYIAPELSLTADTLVRIFGQASYALGLGCVDPANASLYVKWRINSGSYNTYQLWTIGQETAKYVTMELVVDNTIGVSTIKDFYPTLSS